MRTIDVAWIAGFLEGEGSFTVNKRNIVISAAQKQLEPLNRIQNFLGGKIYGHDKHNPGMHKWQRNGSHAIGIMMTIYTLMSPKRKEQIKKCIDFWKTRPVATIYRAENTGLPRGILGNNRKSSELRRSMGLTISHKTRKLVPIRFPNKSYRRNSFNFRIT